MIYLYNLFWFLLLFGVALRLPLVFLKGTDVKYIAVLKKLIAFHFLLGVAYYFFTRNGGGDSWGYWTVAKAMEFSDFKDFLLEGEGTRFMEAFNYFPANILGMDFFANTMLYSLLGAIGICCFFTIALKTIPFNKIVLNYPVFPLVFFLPNLHFWSAGLGKDTLLFTCIGVFSFSLLNPMKRLPLIVISIVLALSVRPHIVLFLLVAFGLAYLFGGKISVGRRVGYSILLLGICIAILPQVLEFVKVDSIDVTVLSNRAESQAGLLAGGSGSSVDVNSYPFPLKIFTYLYRPLFFDARSVGTLLSSFDNLMLLILSWQAFKFKPLKTFAKSPFLVKGFFIFGIIGTLAFATSLGNLGIMVRMKNMFTPGILLYFLWCFSYQAQYEYMISKAKIR